MEAVIGQKRADNPIRSSNAALTGTLVSTNIRCRHIAGRLYPQCIPLWELPRSDTPR